jgi:hypothetical protein
VRWDNTAFQTKYVAYATLEGRSIKTGDLRAITLEKT